MTKAKIKGTLRHGSVFTVTVTLVLGSREGQEKPIGREFGMDTYTRLYLTQITNKTCCPAQGNRLNVMWQPGWKGKFGGEWIYVYV